MAQKFAQFHLRIWTDEEFLALSLEAQHLYGLLLSQEDRGPSGLIPLRPRRWAKLSANGTVEKTMAALHELDATAFVVADVETAEVLIRTFVRNDEIYKHIRLLRVALNQAERIESPRIRSAMGQELAKLPKVVVPARTERNGRAVAEAEAEQQHLDEVVSMLNDAPPDPADGMPSWDDAMGWPHPTGTGTGTGTAVGGWSSTGNQSLDGDARARLRRLRP
jgi:hypothetical protein